MRLYIHLRNLGTIQLVLAPTPRLLQAELYGPLTTRAVSGHGGSNGGHDEAERPAALSAGQHTVVTCKGLRPTWRKLQSFVF